jgi:hypothetical protein
MGRRRGSFFATLLHPRGWLSTFFGWHDEHEHSGLALFTPAEVFFGRAGSEGHDGGDVVSVEQAVDG